MRAALGLRMTLVFTALFVPFTAAFLRTPDISFGKLPFSAISRETALLGVPFQKALFLRNSGEAYIPHRSRRDLLTLVATPRSAAHAVPLAAAAPAPPVPAAPADGEEGVPREFADELIDSFGLYAISTIHSRAIPDTRDGLKPVHRRILYAMQQLGLSHSGPFRKSARVVGEVLGKFHPHGDKAVYDALVRLSQPFVSQLPLIEGHGNFGSVDGDPAAAMRYTECRLSAFCQDALLKDLHTSACVFRPNFDVTEMEPEFLPARAPVLLLQGTTGVAVGFATSIPPHNLNEVVEACVALIDNPRISDSALYRLLPGPDFPTGGILVDPKEAAAAYKEGHGSLRLRARGHLESREPPRSPARGRRNNGHATNAQEERRIVVTELPYGVNKGELVRAATRLVAEKLLPGISDVRDESDFNGIRVAFELLPEASPRQSWRHLLARTALEVSIQCNFVVLKDGKDPKRLSLRGLLEAWFHARLEAVRARTQREQEVLLQQQHISEGMAKAASCSDEILALLKSSADSAEAVSKLMGPPFEFSEAQSQALLRMKLSSLIRLHQQQQQQQLEEMRQRSETLRRLLSDDQELYGIIKEELKDLARKYGGPRRTLLLPPGAPYQQKPSPLSEEELALLNTEGEADEPKDDGRSYLLLVTNRGLYKRIAEFSVGLQRRRTAGLRCYNASSRRDTAWCVQTQQQQQQQDSSSNSMIAAATACKDSDWLLIIWSDGRCLALRAAQLQHHGLKVPPSHLASGTYKQRRMPSASTLAAAAVSGTTGVVSCVARVRRGETEGKVVVATRGGLVKAVQLRHLLPLAATKRQRLRRIISLAPGDAVADCVVIQHTKKEAKGDAKGTTHGAETGGDAAGTSGTETLQSIVLGTAGGRAIRFASGSLRDATPGSSGNKGISLRKGDSVVSVTAVPGGADEGNACLLILTEQGRGKRLGLNQLKMQRRGGTGSSVFRLLAPVGPSDGDSKEGAPEGAPSPTKGQTRKRRAGKTTDADEVSAVRWIGEEQQQQVALVTREGFVVRQSLSSVPRYNNRLARGVALQKLQRGSHRGRDAVVAAALLDEQHEEPTRDRGIRG